MGALVTLEAEFIATSAHHVLLKLVTFPLEAPVVASRNWTPFDRWVAFRE